MLITYVFGIITCLGYLCATLLCQFYHEQMMKLVAQVINERLHDLELDTYALYI